MEKELINILEKVSTLYQKYGIKSVTIDDVAKELGISKKTLYQYVPDKTALVEKVMRFVFERHIDYIENLKEQKLNAIEELLEVNRLINNLLRSYTITMEYDLRKYYPDMFKNMCKIRREKMLESITANMKKGIKEGLFRDDLNVDIIAKLHLFRVENLFNNNIYTVEEITSSVVFNEIFNYHLRGIANVKGVKFLEKKLKELNSEDNGK